MYSDESWAITATQVSKRYNSYNRPLDRLKKIFRKSRKKIKQFTALNAVSFSVKKGSTVGIIGQNGSGKSTLLQIICGTLHADEARIRIRGRIASLLELGAGFNPEFSGKENLLLNAALLGLSAEEINARYETIVRFADIREFIESPVKTYSSGMYVRLAKDYAFLQQRMSMKYCFPYTILSMKVNTCWSQYLKIVLIQYPLITSLLKGPYFLVYYAQKNILVCLFLSCIVKFRRVLSKSKSR